jgi:hypothetical protein
LVGKSQVELLVDLGSVDGICLVKEDGEAGHLFDQGRDLCAGEAGVAVEAG